MPYLRTVIFNPAENVPGSLLRTKEGQRIEAKTLGEAVQVAEKIFHARIFSHDPPKFFRVHQELEQPESFALVDIHLLRNGEEICLKQDLSFVLMDSDIVVMGVLAC